MTELQVLQRLERAYSRKWWQFWIKKVPANEGLFGMLFNVCKKDLSLGKKVWPMLIKNAKADKLQTIRAAIEKLKQDEKA